MKVIDPDELVRQTTSTTDRLVMSARQTAKTLACVVRTGGGDLTKGVQVRSATSKKVSQSNTGQEPYQ